MQFENQQNEIEKNKKVNAQVHFTPQMPIITVNHYKDEDEEIYATMPGEDEPNSTLFERMFLKKSESVLPKKHAPDNQTSRDSDNDFVNNFHTKLQSFTSTFKTTTLPLKEHSSNGNERKKSKSCCSMSKKLIFILILGFIGGIVMSSMSSKSKHLPVIGTTIMILSILGLIGKIYLLIFYKCHDIDMSKMIVKETNSVPVEENAYHHKITPVNQKSGHFANMNYAKGAAYSQGQYTDYRHTANMNYTNPAAFSQEQYSGTEHPTNINYAKDAGFSDAQYSDSRHPTNINYAKDAGFSDAQYSDSRHPTNINYAKDAGFSDFQYSDNEHPTNMNYAKDAGFSYTQYSDSRHPTNINYAKDAAFSEAHYSDSGHFANREYGNLPAFSQVQYNPILVGSQTNLIENENHPYIIHQENSSADNSNSFENSAYIDDQRVRIQPNFV